MPACSNCQIEIQIENRFCSNCDSRLWISWNGATLAKLFEGVKIDAGTRLHNLAMYRLWKMGKELGFHSITEYPFPDLVQTGKTNLINVVWKSDEEIEFAFEIQTKAKNLDLIISSEKTTKLRNLTARMKFVVNVSNKTGKAYFNQITGDPIRVIPQNMSHQKAYDLSEIRKKHKRAYAGWTQDEDVELIKYYKEGLSVAQLAKNHQRRIGAISSRLGKLGLIESPNVSERTKFKETNLVTVLVKSEKKGRYV